MKRLFLVLPLLAASQLPGQELPRPAPPFSVQLPTGKAVSLTDYKGKVIVLAGLLST
jgi:hypothetical protein